MLALQLTGMRFGTSNGFSALNWMLLPCEVAPATPSVPCPVPRHAIAEDPDARVFSLAHRFTEISRRASVEQCGRLRHTAVPCSTGTGGASSICCRALYLAPGCTRNQFWRTPTHVSSSTRRAGSLAKLLPAGTECCALQFSGQADFEPADVDGRPIDVAFFDAGHLIEQLASTELAHMSLTARRRKVQPESFRAAASSSGSECLGRCARYGFACAAGMSCRICVRPPAVPVGQVRDFGSGAPPEADFGELDNGSDFVSAGRGAALQRGELCPAPWRGRPLRGAPKWMSGL